MAVFTVLVYTVYVIYTIHVDNQVAKVASAI